MIICEIVAGGTGMRMGNTVPKQFLMIDEQPIIVRTLKAFIKSGIIDSYVICAPIDYLDKTREILEEYNCCSGDIHIVAGGKCRNESVFNGCKYIKSSFDISNDDIITTHDAVRPFISPDVIVKNIELAKKHAAVSTVVPCVDTIMSSKDGSFAYDIPDRDCLFRVQTPQTFSFTLLWDILNSASDDELLKYSDTAGLAMSRGIKVALVRGEDSNIKITTPFDIAVAENICADSQPV
ncbi:MAG: 2-C-methyl-D-erythritol 4-phosphate cytidylyltransferase 1 [Firmicutes bacterium ADurb.Bin300]|nr:MAG: 2-C-methyl-D-erythritol 4-phosphate cytidylyltransferase 1 [Firmicutes bacterium ADurb.Bin300]HOD02300.1 IspD/TarI family cytidylyltransferase [Clostridiales bacterium]